MKNKAVLSFLFLILLSSQAIAMDCFVNGKQIPCDVWWATYGWFMAIPFTAIGIVALLKSDWIIGLQIKQQKLMGSVWRPGKLVRKGYKWMGAIFLILGLIFFYLTISSI